MDHCRHLTLARQNADLSTVYYISTAISTEISLQGSNPGQSGGLETDALLFQVQESLFVIHSFAYDVTKGTIRHKPYQNFKGQPKAQQTAMPKENQTFNERHHSSELLCICELVIHQVLFKVCQLTAE